MVAVAAMVITMGALATPTAEGAPMVTAMTVAMAATKAAAAETKTMVATVMAGGTDNNQLKVAS
jgi:hypothetical protein